MFAGSFVMMVQVFPIVSYDGVNVNGLYTKADEKRTIVFYDPNNTAGIFAISRCILVFITGRCKNKPHSPLWKNRLIAERGNNRTKTARRCATMIVMPFPYAEAARRPAHVLRLNTLQ